MVGVVVEVAVELARVAELTATRRALNLTLRLLLLATVERVLVAHVVVQRTVVGKGDAAHAAHVRLLAQVAVDVLVQAVLDLEHVAAQPTLVAVQAVLRLVVDLLEVRHDGSGRRQLADARVGVVVSAAARLHRLLVYRRDLETNLRLARWVTARRQRVRVDVWRFNLHQRLGVIEHGRR